MEESWEANLAMRVVEKGRRCIQLHVHQNLTKGRKNIFCLNTLQKSWATTILIETLPKIFISKLHSLHVESNL